MELTMTNNFGFRELNENEVMTVDGGVTVVGALRIAAGVVGVAALITAAVCTAPISGTVYFFTSLLSGVSVALGVTGAFE